jgi:signal transduction histidine kinase
LQQIGLACILVVPLISRVGDEDRILGCVCLARKEHPAYSQDEIVRIMAICDHLANLVDSDRRRKLAIALFERQRLLRDLHDSVSQKLYGLVTLTEAAQAALETGNAIDPLQLLTRIGENARQAVREMRLFLYQMQPLDLENEGLVSALHHRLAAVEGRANIKARLLADENIALSLDKEIALYFIAQEALNNILRHARATTISVILKQSRKNVILEIVDDGRGFDPKKLDRAGWGLANMKERTKNINGKIRILSKPGQGTKITISVQRDLLMPHKRRR